MATVLDYSTVLDCTDVLGTAAAVTWDVMPGSPSVQSQKVIQTFFGFEKSRKVGGQSMRCFLTHWTQINNRRRENLHLHIVTALSETLDYGDTTVSFPWQGFRIWKGQTNMRTMRVMWWTARRGTDRVTSSSNIKRRRPYRAAVCWCSKEFGAHTCRC